MKSASDIVMKAVGVLLLVAAILKGWQLLTEPTANNSIWTSRAFSIVQVELELFLGTWLLSGLFKKAAWLISTMCFVMFSAVTLYKGITGAESCGCFGSVHINPWITLLAIDLPAVIALSVFRPKHVGALLGPMPPIRRLVRVACPLFVLLMASAALLALSEPDKVTSSYEILEPETWIGKQLPILEHIDIAEQLNEGTWVVMLYHHDCPDCAEAIPRYERMAEHLSENEEFLRVALIEVPPLAKGPIGHDSPCTLGCLSRVKEWFVTTPAVALLNDGQVSAAWEGDAPGFDTILARVVAADDAGGFLGGVTVAFE